MSALAKVTDGNVALATMAFRHQGRSHLAVVLKASFALVNGGAAQLLGPGVIATEDRTIGRNPARSLELATDLVPFRARCDVTLVGHCHSPRRGPVSAMQVRLGLERAGQPLLDKRIVVIGKRNAQGAVQPFTTMRIAYEHAIGGPGEPNPVGSPSPSLLDRADPTRPIGFGPLSPFWRHRKQLLGSIEPLRVCGPDPELPEDMSWAYFQAAPPEQQIEPLRGGELLLLDGFDPDVPHLVTQLPSRRPAARALFDGGRMIEIDLACDTLAVNSDTRSFDLVWRGHVHGGDATAPAPLVVAAALAPDGLEPDWRELLARAAPAIAARGPAPTTAAPVPRVVEPPLARPAAAEETYGLRAEDHDAAGRVPLAPFAIAQPKTGLNVPAAPGLPWSPGPKPTPAQRVESIGEETVGLTSAARPAAASPPSADLLEARLLSSGMNAEEVAALLSALTPKR